MEALLLKDGTSSNELCLWSCSDWLKVVWSVMDDAVADLGPSKDMLDGSGDGKAELEAWREGSVSWERPELRSRGDEQGRLSIASM